MSERAVGLGLLRLEKGSEKRDRIALLQAGVNGKNESPAASVGGVELLDYT